MEYSVLLWKQRQRVGRVIKIEILYISRAVSESTLWKDVTSSVNQCPYGRVYLGVRLPSWKNMCRFLTTPRILTPQKSLFWGPIHPCYTGSNACAKTLREWNFAHARGVAWIGSWANESNWRFCWVGKYPCRWFRFNFGAWGSVWVQSCDTWDAHVAFWSSSNFYDWESLPKSTLFEDAWSILELYLGSMYESSPALAFRRHFLCLNNFESEWTSPHSHTPSEIRP